MPNIDPPPPVSVPYTESYNGHELEISLVKSQKRLVSGGLSTPKYVPHVYIDGKDLTDAVRKVKLGPSLEALLVAARNVIDRLQ